MRDLWVSVYVYCLCANHLAFHLFRCGVNISRFLLFQCTSTRCRHFAFFGYLRFFFGFDCDIQVSSRVALAFLPLFPFLCSNTIHHPPPPLFWHRSTIHYIPNCNNSFCFHFYGSFCHGTTAIPWLKWSSCHR